MTFVNKYSQTIQRMPNLASVNSVCIYINLGGGGGGCQKLILFAYS